jgi:hypothetical protein
LVYLFQWPTISLHHKFFLSSFGDRFFHLFQSLKRSTLMSQEWRKDHSPLRSAILKRTTEISPFQSPFAKASVGIEKTIQNCLRKENSLQVGFWRCDIREWRIFHDKRHTFLNI